MLKGPFSQNVIVFLGAIQYECQPVFPLTLLCNLLLDHTKQQMGAFIQLVQNKEFVHIYMFYVNTVEGEGRQLYCLIEIIVSNLQSCKHTSFL